MPNTQHVTISPLTSETLHSLETADTLLLSSSIISSLFDAPDGWLLDLPVEQTSPYTILVNLFSPEVLVAFEDEARDTRLQRLLSFGKELAVARPITLGDVSLELDKAQISSLEHEQMFLPRIQALSSAKKKNILLERADVLHITSRISPLFTFNVNAKKELCIMYLSEEEGKRVVINITRLYNFHALGVVDALIDLCIARAFQKDIIRFQKIIEQEQEIHALYRPFGTLLLKILASKVSLANIPGLEQVFIALLHLYTVVWNENKDLFLVPVRPFIIKMLVDSAESLDNTLIYFNQVTSIEHLQNCPAMPQEKRAFFKLLCSFPHLLRKDTISQISFSLSSMQALHSVVLDPSLYIPELLIEEELKERDEGNIMSLFDDLRTCSTDKILVIYDHFIYLLHLTYERDALSYEFIESAVRNIDEFADDDEQLISYLTLNAYLADKASVFLPHFSMTDDFAYEICLAITALRLFISNDTNSFAQKKIQRVFDTIDKAILKQKLNLDEGMEDRNARRIQLQKATLESENMISSDSLEHLYAFFKLNWSNESGEVPLERFNLLYGLYTLYVSGIISPSILAILVTDFVSCDSSEELQHAIIGAIYEIAAKEESDEKKVLQSLLLQAYRQKYL